MRLPRETGLVFVAMIACGLGCGNGHPAGSPDAGASGGVAGSGGVMSTGGATVLAGAGGAAAVGGATGAGGATAVADASGCFRARRLWFEDFETGDYSRWTSKTYDSNWGNDCQSNALSTLQATSPTHSNRSEIVCAYTAEGNVHRGYGGLQFSGDAVVPAYTNAGTGTDAPYGLVNTFHSWLETTSVFQNGKWFSFWTVNSDCGWADEVLTLGLEDPSNRLAAAHYQPGGGTRTFLPGAPGFPLGRWVRITIYVNYYTGIMHVWQDGQEVSHVTFARPKQTICQWHWGAYASGDNDNLVLYEDDNSIWKLEEEWTDLSTEPYFAGTVTACGP
jgi:hypothetical protein